MIFRQIILKFKFKINNINILGKKHKNYSKL